MKGGLQSEGVGDDVLVVAGGVGGGLEVDGACGGLLVEVVGTW